MENRKEPVRKPNEKKSSPMSNNVIWYLLILGVLILVVLALFNNGSEVVIPYSDLLALVKQKGPNEQPRGVLVVHENGTEVRYSHLRDRGWATGKSPARLPARSTARPRTCRFAPT